MGSLTSWLNNIRLRQTLTIFLVGIVFLVSTACSGGNTQATNTKPTTPEAGAYQTDLKGVRSSGNNLSQANQRYVLAASTDSDNLPRNRDQAAKRAIENARSAGKNQFAKSNQKTGNVLEDVREKLNLDEPLYPPTKEVLNEVGDTAKETAEGTQRVAEDTVEGARRAVKDTAKSR